MNPNQPRNLWPDASGLVRAVVISILVILLLSSPVLLGWLLKGFLVLLILIPLLPLAIGYGIQWWFKRNLVSAACPVCGVESQTLNGAEFRCPSCGEALKAEQKQFSRLTPPGTIEVQAQAVDPQADVIEVQVHKD